MAKNLGAQTTQPSTPERESQVARSSPEKWNLGNLEAGPDHGDGEGQKATSTSPEKYEAITYPEGGVRAWLVVFGSWCAVFASLGTANSFGSFQSYFLTHQLSSYSPSVVGWIFSTYAFLVFGGSLFVGPIFDRFGPNWLVLAGSIGASLSMFLVGICTQYWDIFLVFGLLGGLSGCLLFTPAVAVIGHYFRNKRGNATGIAVSSGAIAGAIFPLMLEFLIPKVGFAWSTRVIGFIYACAGVIVCNLVRTRLPPGRNSNAKPDFRILKDPAFFLTVVGSYFLQFTFFVPIAYISSYALHYGFSSASSYHALVFLNVGSIFGRWLPGFTSDKIGRYNSMILMSMLTSVSALGIWLPAGHTKAGLIAFAVSYGFCSGSTTTLTGVCIGQLCETQDYGRYISTAFTIASTGYLTGIPIAGELLARDHGDYQYLIIFVGICFACAVAAFVSVRVLRTGWKLMVVY